LNKKRWEFNRTAGALYSMWIKFNSNEQNHQNGNSYLNTVSINFYSQNVFKFQWIGIAYACFNRWLNYSLNCIGHRNSSDQSCLHQLL